MVDQKLNDFKASLIGVAPPSSLVRREEPARGLSNEDRPREGRVNDSPSSVDGGDAVRAAAPPFRNTSCAGMVGHRTHKKKGGGSSSSSRDGAASVPLPVTEGTNGKKVVRWPAPPLSSVVVLRGGSGISYEQVLRTAKSAISLEEEVGMSALKIRRARLRVFFLRSLGKKERRGLIGWLASSARE